VEHGQPRPHCHPRG